MTSSGSTTMSKTRTITNKSFEICVLLVTVYILIELNQVPSGCEHSSECLNDYINNGGDVDPDYIVLSCADMREACFRSYAYKLAQVSKTRVLTAAESQINSTYYAHVQFCECMVETVNEPVFCDFDDQRNHFFWAGVLFIYLMEATAISSLLKYFRLFTLALAVGYFFVAAMIFNNTDRCSSIAYELKSTIIRDLSFACFAVMSGTCGLEVLMMFGVVSGSCCRCCCGNSEEKKAKKELKKQQQQQQQQQHKLNGSHRGSARVAPLEVQPSLQHHPMESWQVDGDHELERLAHLAEELDSEEEV